MAVLRKYILTELRAEDRSEGADPVHGLRRQDHLPVRARNDHAGDRGASSGDLWGGSLARLDFQRHRSGDGRSEDLAGPVAGRGIPDPLYRSIRLPEE